jgi:hypothetical protein
VTVKVGRARRRHRARGSPVIAKYTAVPGGADIEIVTRTTTLAIMRSIRLDRGPSGPVRP